MNVLVTLTLLVAAQAAGEASSNAPPANARETTVLVLDLQAVGVPATTATLVTGLIVDEVGRRPRVKVTSAEELRRLVALQADKDVVGCDEASCLAEVAAAMGAELVVFGDLGQLGSSMLLTLRVYDVQAGAAVGRQTIEARDIDGLRPRIPNAVVALLSSVTGEEQPLALAPPPATAGPDAVLLWTGASVGALGLLTSLAGGGAALYFEKELADPDGPPSMKEAGLLLQPWMWVMSGLGAAALLAGGGVAAAAFVVGEEP